MSLNNSVLDMSNSNLKQIPDLRHTKYTEVNLSKNRIEKLDFSKLPYTIKKLNFSHNKLKGNISLRDKTYKLSFLDLSYNEINHFDSNYPLDTLKLNNNKLKGISCYVDNMKFLDISENRDLSNELDIPVDKIKYIKRDNIRNDLPLKFKLNEIFRNRHKN
ncbi:hypothetical protein [Chryseobacterium wanjuense]